MRKFMSKTIFWAPWSTVSQGTTVPGSLVSAVKSELYLTDPNGGVYTTLGSAERGWGPWTRVPGLRSVPGSPVTAVDTISSSERGRTALFTTDHNGEVHTTLG